ncbi:MAG: hypothetical protein KKA73_19945 [Chloroflexi bacterium]|nr:hypothetical protein [Chloroflexota bacterium]MBU1749962.1 hypothetical protein [Chloroflexota bacterium]
MSNERAGRSPLDPVWVLAALGGIFAFVSTHPIRPQDFWWHVRVGQIVAGTGTVPATDLFSFTAAGQPYAYQNWLAGLLFYGTYRVGGLELVVLMQALAITLAYGLILWLCWRIAGHVRLAVLATLLAAVVGIGNWNVRPQTFSILLFAVFLVILTRYCRGERAGIALLPVLMVAWVNLHGAFMLGFALPVLVLAGETGKRLVRWQGSTCLSWRNLGLLTIVAVLLFLAMLVNPRGPLIYSYVGELQTNTAVQGLMAEWVPTDIRTPAGLAFLGVAGLVALLLVLRGRRTDPADLLIYGAFLWLGVSAVRNQLWLGLVAAPLVAGYGPAVWPAVKSWLDGLPGLDRWLARPRKPAPARPWINAAFAFLLTLAIVASLPWVKVNLPLPEAKRPVVSPETPLGAVAFIQQSGWTGHLFHFMDYGSYLIWAAPDVPVFVDTRIELYPGTVWDDYLAITLACHDWEDRLSDWGIDMLMLDRAGQPLLIGVAEASPNWERRYEDETTIIFARHGF